MAKYLTDELELQSVANAIRAKGGTSESLAFPSGFVSAIEGIETGGGGDNSVEDGIITKTISGSYYNSRVTNIGDNAFYNCTSLTTVSFPACAYIGNSAFYNCTNLTTVSFSACTNIGTYAFNGCILTTVSFPACTNIGNSAFNLCSDLTTVNFPACMNIGTYAFYNCTSLTIASFPVCTSIGNNAFYNCTHLTTMNFPACTYIGNSVFNKCSRLTTASFPACTNIGNSAFKDCRNLLSVYFMGSSMPSLTNSNVFSSTPIAGYTTSTNGVYGSIYVPASMLESYKTANNWSYFSDRFVGVE